MGDRALMVIEPNMTMRSYANKIPEAIRGNIYEQYMVKQQRWWDDHPCYPWDEWTAYLNGSLTRLELGITTDSSEVQFMLEMMVYSSYVLIVGGNDPGDSDNVQRRAVFKFLAEASFQTFWDQADAFGARDYWARVAMHGPDVLKLMDELEIKYPEVMGVKSGIEAGWEIDRPIGCKQADAATYDVEPGR